MAEERFGSIVFRRNFDSGNFGSVEKIEHSNEEDLLEFKVWTSPDCAGTQYENGNRTWFHFSVSGVPTHKTLKITMCNLNKQSKLYSQGMAPVYRTVPGKLKWERIRDRPTYEMIDGQFHLTFLHTVLDSKITTYFAFVYPFSYSDLQKKLELIGSRFVTQPWNLASWKSGSQFPNEAIYYHCTTLCHTLNKLKVQLLTISSPHGMCNERESMLANLFPDGPTSLPRKFKGKKVYFISSRVHPGEVPASFVLNGFLAFILRPTDPRAVLLRQLFVFKVVPMLNPDGVYKGHYRTDSRGVNLNRYYINPCPKLHPSIYGAKAIVMYHHRGGRDCECGADDKFRIVRGNGQSVSTSGGVTNVVHSPAPESSPSDKINEQVQSILENLRKDIDCSDEEFQSKMAARVTEICSKMAQLNQPPPALSPEPQKPVQLRTAPVPVATESPEPLRDPNQNIETRVCVCGTNPTVLPVNRHVLEHGGGIPENVHPESGIEMYVDLHGHASKRGCFIYGNNLVDSKQIENITYPRLIAYNSVHFDFPGCCFTERNMYAKDKSDGLSKEGSGRVGIYKSTGIVHSYTLECNYNMGRQLNQLPPASKDNGRATPPLSSAFPPKYTTDSWEDVGKALAIGLLDLHNVNPWSRLLNTDVINVHGLRGLMFRTSKGSNNTGPGVLRRLAYATSKITNANVDNTKPPRPHPKNVRGVMGAPITDVNRQKRSLRRITNASSKTDLTAKRPEPITETTKESLDTESDSCSKSDMRHKASKLTDSTDSSSSNSKTEKKSTLLRQTSASLAKRSDKVLRRSAEEQGDTETEVTVQYSRSLYGGVYKLDVEDENYPRVKKIYPAKPTGAKLATVVNTVVSEKQQASLCNFIDLSDSNNVSQQDSDDLDHCKPKVSSLTQRSISCGQLLGTAPTQLLSPANNSESVQLNTTSQLSPQPKVVRRTNTNSYYPSFRNGKSPKKVQRGKGREWPNVLRELHGPSDTSTTGMSDSSTSGFPHSGSLSNLDPLQ